MSKIFLNDMGLDHWFSSHSWSSVIIHWKGSGTCKYNLRNLCKRRSYRIPNKLEVLQCKHCKCRRNIRRKNKYQAKSKCFRKYLIQDLHHSFPLQIYHHTQIIHWLECSLGKHIRCKDRKFELKYYIQMSMSQQRECIRKEKNMNNYRTQMHKQHHKKPVK